MGNTQNSGAEVLKEVAKFDDLSKHIVLGYLDPTDLLEHKSKMSIVFRDLESIRENMMFYYDWVLNRQKDIGVFRNIPEALVCIRSRRSPMMLSLVLRKNNQPFQCRYRLQWQWYGRNSENKKLGHWMVWEQGAWFPIFKIGPNYT